MQSCLHPVHVCTTPYIQFKGTTIDIKFDELASIFTIRRHKARQLKLFLPPPSINGNSNQLLPCRWTPLYFPFFIPVLQYIALWLHNILCSTVSHTADKEFLLTFIENYVEADWPPANYSLRLHFSVCGLEKAQVRLISVSHQGTEISDISLIQITPLSGERPRNLLINLRSEISCSVTTWKFIELMPSLSHIILPKFIYDLGLA